MLIFAVFFAGVMTVPSLCEAKPASKGIHVQYHTQKEIRSFVKKHKFNTKGKISYSKKPTVAASSYQPGTLKKSSLTEGLNALNTMRYVAGIPSNVKLNSAYSKQCQAAALLNAANNTLSHYPVKPAGIKESLYQLGEQGAKSSNIAYASWDTNLAFGVVNQWMEDSDDSNIDRVGHRRWILNPSMKKTGFGYVSHYSAMYAFDGAFGSTKYYGVAWPAQNMPLDYFSDRTAWSISMGKYVDPAKVKVTLIRKSDKKKWIFSKKNANGRFYVNNDNYGQTGCIIFRPDNISYQSGDVFQVKITGLEKTVSYEVRFFKL